ncbi:MAG: dockerin type I repeat-containing protein [Oscillospiraceae bacterium]|nr:dockerin type I repeat-containing protein [Oscillospiraceae bacterium]
MLKEKILKISLVLMSTAMLLQSVPIHVIAEDTATIATETIQLEYLPGDVNGNGNFSILDIIILQRWLLGKGNLTCWQNADLTQDGIINIFDLCLMKQNLIRNTQAKTDEFIPYKTGMDDVFVDYVVIVTIKQQYRYPEKHWTMEDFKGVENIDSVQDATPPSSNRQILYILLKDCSQENVLKMICDIEALNREEIYTVRPTSWETYAVK